MTNNLPPFGAPAPQQPTGPQPSRPTVPWSGQQPAPAQPQQQPSWQQPTSQLPAQTAPMPPQPPAMQRPQAPAPAQPTPAPAQPAQGQPAPAQPDPGSTKAETPDWIIAALALIGPFLCCLYLGVIPSGAAAVWAFIRMQQFKKAGRKAPGLLYAGLIIGIVMFIFSFISFVWFTIWMKTTEI